jgi:hypothetical protein
MCWTILAPTVRSLLHCCSAASVAVGLMSVDRVRGSFGVAAV